MLFHNDKKQLFIINVLLNMLFKIKNKISYKVLALLWMMTASVCLVAVSYTHLTLPTICSV